MCDCDRQVPSRDFTIGVVMEHPEDFQFNFSGWTGSVISVTQGHTSNGQPLWHVVYEANYRTRVATVKEEQVYDLLRRKPAWNPTPDKLYMFYDNSARVMVPGIFKYMNSSGRFVAEHNMPYGPSTTAVWMYCKEVPASEIGK